MGRRGAGPAPALRARGVRHRALVVCRPDPGRGPAPAHLGSGSRRGPGGVRVGGARLARGGQDPCRADRGRPDRPYGPHRPPRGDRGRGGRADDGRNAAAPLPYSRGPEHRSRKRRRYSTCWSAFSSDRILIASSVSGSATAGSSAASRISARSVRARAVLYASPFARAEARPRVCPAVRSSRATAAASATASSSGCQENGAAVRRLPGPVRDAGAGTNETHRRSTRE